LQGDVVSICQLTLADRIAADGLTASLPLAPSPSLAWGSAGSAYFLLRYGALRGHAAALEAACQQAAIAVDNAVDGAAEHWRAIASETPEMAKSLYYHQPGVWCVRALVAAGADDTSTTREAVRRFAELAADPVDEYPDDATLGRPSLLLGCAALIEALDDPIATETVREAGHGVSAQVADVAAERADREPEPGERLGAAHGLAGLAHVLLRWSQATGDPPVPAALRLLERLVTVRRPSGLWPIRAGSREVWQGWCNGSAGFAQLWALAFELTGETEFLEFAKRTGADAIEAYESEIPNLCCGLGGQAYAALSLHRVTGESAWLEEARRLAATAATQPMVGHHLDDLIDGAHGLLKGEPGVALLLTELEQPAHAGMPLWEACRRAER
jgi:eukaryotic-like serine/threonine-protein kinase